MGIYKTPGVYVEELSSFPPSVADVATAVPVFIGFTENGEVNKPVRISSMLEYETKFGFGNKPSKIMKGDITNNYVMYDSIRMFYDNGGGVCWIYPIGIYNESLTDVANKFGKAVERMDEMDEVTLILFPDATMMLDKNELASLQVKALSKAAELQDKFVILDVKDDDVQGFRNTLSADSEVLRYGAAYYPMLRSVYKKSFSIAEILEYDKNDILWKDNEIIKFYKNILSDTKALDKAPSKEKEPVKKDVVEFFKQISNEYRQKIDSLILRLSWYKDVINEMNSKACMLPPSGAIAGVISRIDSSRGVWASPANAGINSVVDLTVTVTDAAQERLNVDTDAGKSINAIRWFSGKGIMVWGARTLDGNSNEWRYVSVRRLFNYVEESVKKSTAWAVFQPNDANTWVKMKSQIENFLNNLWREGALAGASPAQAFFVKVGMPETMTAQDILEGRVIVKIGMAAVRPAEFIVLQFSHMMQK